MDELGASPARRIPTARGRGAPPRGATSQRRVAAVVATAVALALAVAALPRLPQPAAYHRFADGRTLLGVPNALNVLSNLALLAAGAAGLVAAARARLTDRRERAPWLVAFSAVTLTALGSAWYHLAPSNATLVWDRLPMAASFAAVLAALVAERIGAAAGARLLGPLVVLAPATVLYWFATEAAGVGDLRPYVFAQSFPLLAIPLLLALFPARYDRGGAWLGGLAMYALAKGAEMADALAWRLTGVVSGHTVKHLAAAVAVGLLAWMLRTRAPRVETGALPTPCARSGR